MKRATIQYVCSQCGRKEGKWLGRCPDCGAWNSFVEEVVHDTPSKSLVSKANKVQPINLQEVTVESDFSYSSGITEFDRVLGGSVMRGGTILLGGEPGIGKSTLMLQFLASIEGKNLLYVSGEESASQVKMRGERLNLPLSRISLLGETNLESLLHLLHTNKPDIIVIDSLQTLSSREIPSPAGSISQMRTCSQELVDAAKQVGTTLFFIAHITKEGQIAGPKAIEHIVDTVLYFEQASSGVRIIRAVKNRFGSVDEIGIFLMGEKGLTPVADPAGFFLDKRKSAVLPAGIAFTAVIEGSRTFLVEIQALTIPVKGSYARVYSERIDTARVTRVAAVLERHAHISLSERDIYVNVGGGIKLSEVSIELPLALALYSAVTGNSLPASLVSMGELSLAGEVRPVSFGEKRIKGALSMGFDKLLLPSDLLDKKGKGLYGCDRIDEALKIVESIVRQES